MKDSTSATSYRSPEKEGKELKRIKIQNQHPRVITATITSFDHNVSLHHQFFNSYATNAFISKENNCLAFTVTKKFGINTILFFEMMIATQPLVSTSL